MGKRSHIIDLRTADGMITAYEKDISGVWMPEYTDGLYSYKVFILDEWVYVNKASYEKALMAMKIL